MDEPESLLGDIVTNANVVQCSVFVHRHPDGRVRSRSDPGSLLLVRAGQQSSTAPANQAPWRLTNRGETPSPGRGFYVIEPPEYRALG